MWEPADPACLPSRSDFENAQNAISYQERELEATDRRAEELKRDIQRRQAWIAPVRKLTNDTLSHIFMHTSDLEWKAPFRIGAVSRQWRAVVLATPRAWTNIEMASKPPLNLLELYFQRSGKIPLHLSRFQTAWGVKLSFVVLRPKPYNVDKLYEKYARRIRCAMVDRVPILGTKATFASMEQLSVDFLDHRSAFMLSHDRFPKLRHLRINRPHGVLDTKTRYPLIQSLYVHNGYSNSTPFAASMFSATLTSLCVGRIHGETTDESGIVLPCLQVLTLYFDTESDPDLAPSGWPSDVKTPTLQYYGQHGSGWTAQHRDLATVTHLRLAFNNETEDYARQAPLSFETPNLRELQISFLPVGVMGHLLRDVPRYRHLEIIRTDTVYGEYGIDHEDGPVYCKELPDVPAAVAEANQGRQNPVNVKVTSNWDQKFPDEFVAACGEELPCWHDKKT